ncbi:hypothetical protein [Methylorubrum sp. POS3]|uniref:hypothetical protein n=1 Tax=Methylorubrum sp. POS3 TaxID=2998492 RepID=UPI0037265BF8
MDRVLSRFTPLQPEAFTYRVFYLDQRGVVCRAEVIDASSDVEACRIAATLESDYGIVLWERSRFLAQYAAQPSAAEWIA